MTKLIKLLPTGNAETDINPTDVDGCTGHEHTKAAGRERRGPAEEKGHGTGEKHRDQQDSRGGVEGDSGVGGHHAYQ